MQKKYVIIAVLLLIGSFSYSPAYAGQGRGNRGRHKEGIVKQTRQTHETSFSYPNWFGLSLIFGNNHQKMLVTSFSVNQRPIRYISVPQTSTVYNILPQTTTVEIITIHIPNSNGSYTPITLIRSNNGYIGPQGEYYAGHPTVEQLRMLYGK